MLSQEQLDAKNEITAIIIQRTTLLSILGILSAVYMPVFLPIIVIGFMFHIISSLYQIIHYKFVFGSIPEVLNTSSAQQDRNVAPNYRIFRINV